MNEECGDQRTKDKFWTLNRGRELKQNLGQILEKAASAAEHHEPCGSQSIHRTQSIKPFQGKKITDDRPSRRQECPPSRCICSYSRSARFFRILTRTLSRKFRLRINVNALCSTYPVIPWRRPTSSECWRKHRRRGSRFGPAPTRTAVPPN